MTICDGSTKEELKEKDRVSLWDILEGTVSPTGPSRNRNYVITHVVPESLRK